MRVDDWSFWDGEYLAHRNFQKSKVSEFEMIVQELGARSGEIAPGHQKGATFETSNQDSSLQ